MFNSENVRVVTSLTTLRPLSEAHSENAGVTYDGRCVSRKRRMLGPMLGTFNASSSQSPARKTSFSYCFF